jgi:CelD/BcsL family acetyltransferase involved in cellulose biosynthesis
MTQILLRDRIIGDFATGAVAPAMEGLCRLRPANDAAPIEWSLVTTFEDFEALEDDWNTLHRETARKAHVFQSFNWCWHWCRHYLGDGTTGPSLAIVTGRIDARLVLVMPLVTRRKSGLVELTWLSEPVSQYGDVLAAPVAASLEALEAAWRLAVTRTGADVANLRRVRDDAVAAPLLTHLGADVTAAEDAPFLELTEDQSFKGWETRRRPRAIKNRRRQQRRLAEQGEIKFLALSGGEEAATLAAHAVRLKRESLADKGAISLALGDARFERFFADAAHGCGRPAGVTVMALTSLDEPAALKILLETDDAAFLHVAVFEPRFEKCGVGALLLEHVVERTILAGRRELDLLPPRHDYKLDFADGIVVVRDYAVALSTKGRIYTRGFLKLRRQIKRTIEALPKPLRQLIGRLASSSSASQPSAAQSKDHSAA